jgi:hypothetical protein
MAASPLWCDNNKSLIILKSSFISLRLQHLRRTAPFSQPTPDHVQSLLQTHLSQAGFGTVSLIQLSYCNAFSLIFLTLLPLRTYEAQTVRRRYRQVCLEPCSDLSIDWIRHHDTYFPNAWPLSHICGLGVVSKDVVISVCSGLFFLCNPV